MDLIHNVTYVLWRSPWRVRRLPSEPGGNAMRIFHRFTHTVSAGIESLLDQVENQEAGARGRIDEIEQGAGGVGGHSKGAERRLHEVEAPVEALGGQAQPWKERARRFRDHRDTALG